MKHSNPRRDRAELIRVHDERDRDPQLATRDNGQHKLLHTVSNRGNSTPHVSFTTGS